jgi:hypothetical protein
LACLGAGVDWDFASAFLKDEEVVLVVETTLSFFEWLLLGADRGLASTFGFFEDDWKALGVVDFSSISGVFGDLAFIAMLSLSSGISVMGGVDALETTLGFLLGRVLQEVLVLLDVMNPMLLSVPTGDISSKASDEEVANEMFEPMGISTSLSFLNAFFFFLPVFLFGFGLSAIMFSWPA